MMRPMTSEAVEALRNVPLFAGIDDRDLERLGRLFRERTFSEGATVVREGDPGVGFFVILEGSAEVSAGGELRSALGPGDAFGEMALLDEGPRSATVVAATDLRCLGLSAWEFRPFLEEHPSVAWAMLQTLARRVRELES